MYITRALIGRKPCLDQAIQTRKSKLLSRERFKNMAECSYFIEQLLYGSGHPNTWKVARVKKSARNHSPLARSLSLSFPENTEIKTAFAGTF